MSACLRPENLEDALASLSERPHRILAGGTDVYPADAAAVGWGKPGIDHPDALPILDVSALDALSGIRRFPDRIEIGALVTWTEAIESDLPAWFDGVRLAAREVGGRQIQNRGTLAGNLCNASPAADGVPALLVLDARVRLQSRGGSRELPLVCNNTVSGPPAPLVRNKTVPRPSTALAGAPAIPRQRSPLEGFITGNRRTRLRPDELMTAIVIPSPAADARSTFLKLGARRYLVISIAMVAACLELKEGRIRDARVAVGACSEVAQRLKGLEARLQGVPAAEAPDMVRDEDFASLSPMDDVRASASYRRHGARVLVHRALDALTCSEEAGRRGLDTPGRSEEAGRQGPDAPGGPEDTGRRAPGEPARPEDAERQALGAPARSEGAGRQALGAPARSEGAGRQALGASARSEGAGRQALDAPVRSEDARRQALGAPARSEGAGRQTLDAPARSEGAGR